MAVVRVFSLSGLSTAPVRTARGHADSVQLAIYPPLGRDLLNCTTGSADLSEASAAPKGCTIAMVQVETGRIVHFEIIPAGRTLVTADTTSPTMSGQQVFNWGEGWRISVLEATS